MTRRRLRILVADDSAFARRISCHLLRQCEADMEEAADGDEAVMWTFLDEFDLVLMDVQMPEMDGLEATRYLRDVGFRGPIVATSGSASHADIAECLAAGMDDHLPKPFTHGQLERLLERIAS